MVQRVKIIEYQTFSLLLAGPLNQKMSVLKTLKCQLFSWMPSWGCLTYTWAQDSKEGVWNTTWTCCIWVMSPTPSSERNTPATWTERIPLRTWRCSVLVAWWGSQSNTRASRRKERTIVWIKQYQEASPFKIALAICLLSEILLLEFFFRFKTLKVPQCSWIEQ